MFFVRKGFGFIKPDDSGDEIFVHHSAIGGDGFKTLADGEAVEYEVEDGAEDGKPRAVNVTGPGGAKVQGIQKGGRKPRGGKKASRGGKGKGKGKVKSQPSVNPPSVVLQAALALQFKFPVSRKFGNYMKLQ